MSKRKKLPKRCIVIKGLRCRENLTQEQLAKKINISRSTMSKIETGKKEISSEAAKKLAKALKTKQKIFD